MKKGIVQIAELRERIAAAHLTDKSNAFNTARMEALELDNLLEVAEATAITTAGAQGKPGRPRARRLSGSRRRELLCHSLYLPKDKRVSKRAVNFAPSRSRRCSRPVHAKC